MVHILVLLVIAFAAFRVDVTAEKCQDFANLKNGSGKTPFFIKVSRNSTRSLNVEHQNKSPQTIRTVSFRICVPTSFLSNRLLVLFHFQIAGCWGGFCNFLLQKGFILLRETKTRSTSHNAIQCIKRFQCSKHMSSHGLLFRV